MIGCQPSDADGHGEASGSGTRAALSLRMMIRSLALALALTTVGAARADVANAAPSSAAPRSSALSYELYGTPRTIERARTRDRKAVRFFADPQRFDSGAVMLFEIHSHQAHARVERWSCVALEDVSECLGAPVRVPFLARDHKIVLTMTALPRSAAVAGRAHRGPRLAQR